jgi:hypothetical protein
MQNNDKNITFFHFDYGELFLGPNKWILNPISYVFSKMEKVPVFLNNYDDKGNILDTKIDAWAFGEKK